MTKNIRTPQDKDANDPTESGNSADSEAFMGAAAEAAGPAGTDPRADVVLPKLGFFGSLRWAWRQLTSMRTALFLLLMLAVAAVPGSLFPQRPVSPANVTTYLSDHPHIGPVMDWFRLFDVYSSPWFAAIYLLLFASLIGCVAPRAKAHYKAMRSQPPRTPRRLSRLAEYGTMEIPAGTGKDAESAVRDAAAVLKKRGYRVEVRDADGARPSVGAERGFMKEVGNLVFHTALIGVLIAVAMSTLFGYTGQRILVEGDTFVNTLVDYDSFTPGTYFNTSTLAPFSLTLNKFSVVYDRSSVAHYGQPLDFTADVTSKDSPTSAAKKQVLKVNSPLALGGTNVYLTGNGYAPIVTVRDGKGNIAFQGPVVSVPTDGAYTSLIVIKVPDAQPSQLGFVGFFLPTALETPQGVAYASDPDPFNPQLDLNSYYGDLGLDDGVPRNVYTLDTNGMTQLNGKDMKSGGLVLAPGGKMNLPDGKGSISFDGIKRYVALDVHSDPAQDYVLIFAILALGGLICSLFLNRRRVWIRTGNHPDGRTMVEYGLLARGEDHRLAAESVAIAKALRTKWLVPENGMAAGDASSDSAVTEESSTTAEDGTVSAGKDQ